MLGLRHFAGGRSAEYTGGAAAFNAPVSGLNRPENTTLFPATAPPLARPPPTPAPAALTSRSAAPRGPAMARGFGGGVRNIPSASGETDSRAAGVSGSGAGRDETRFPGMGV